MIETTALGGRSSAPRYRNVGGLKELRSAWRPGKQFQAKMKAEVRRGAILARWKSAVQRA